MNKKRRQEIMKAMNKVEEVKDRLDELLYEEQDALDNTPENLRLSFRGEESENAVDYLQEAIEGLENCLSNLECI